MHNTYQEARSRLVKEDGKEGNISSPTPFIVSSARKISESMAKSELEGSEKEKQQRSETCL